MERLGAGGMAEVYRAQPERGAGAPDQSFVVKRLKPFYVNNHSAVRMFAEEAKLAASIRHANIVPVYDLVQLADGETFITMEHVDGPDLRWLLNMVRRRRRRLPIWFSIFLCTEVLQALQYLNELQDPVHGDRNVVHCDVTPENVFISSSGTVKLGDFGVAVEDARPEDHHLGQLRGKLPYCSPEQAQGQRLDARSDVYSAATVLWECLAGRPLVHEKSREHAFREVLSARRDPPSSRNSEVSALLDDVVLAALHPDRSQRTPSARIFRDRLLNVLHAMHPKVHREHVVAAMTAVLAPPPRGHSRPSPVDDPAERLLAASVAPASSSDSAATLPSEDLPFATWLHNPGHTTGPLSMNAALSALERTSANELDGWGLSVSGRDPLPLQELLLLLGINMQSPGQDVAKVSNVPLARLALPSLFAQHTHARSTGVLVVRGSPGEHDRHIRIAEGCLVDVWSVCSTFRTWSVLTDEGHQHAEDFAAAMHRCIATGRPVVERLSPELQVMLQEVRLLEVHRQLEEMFAWSQGETYFLATDVAPVAGAPRLARLVPEIILHALDPAQLMAVLEPYLTHRVIASQDLAPEMDEGGLMVEERRLVQTVLQADTLAEGLVSVHEDERFIAGCSIYALHAVGLLRFV